MRRISTVVLPVPAPASTSMGPVTCSMASRCWGSGWSLEVETPLETAIEQENSRVSCAVIGLLRFLKNGRGYRHRCNHGCLGAKNCGPQGCRYPASFAKRLELLLLPAA